MNKQIPKKNPAGLGIAMLFLVGGLAIGAAALLSRKKPAKKKSTAPIIEPEQPKPTAGSTKPNYDPLEARRLLSDLGYTIKINNEKITGAENASVGRFQRDWNAVLAYLGSQTIIVPNTLKVRQLLKGKNTLTADDQMGTATMDALRSARVVQGQDVSWREFANRSIAALK